VKKEFVFGIALTLVAIGGCGGSSSNSSSGTNGGVAFEEFTTTLPDGSAMELEVLANANGVWAGEFAVSAETGPYAHQTGSFEGKVSGNTLTATCEISDGGEFTLTGSANGDKGLKLTRSDIAGTVLNFVPVTPRVLAESRANVSFKLDAGASTGRVVISDSPYYRISTITEYRGSWLGLRVSFWQWDDGHSTCDVYVDPSCIIAADFEQYKLSNFSSSTAIGEGRMTMYSSISKTQIKVKFAPVASP